MYLGGKGKEEEEKEEELSPWAMQGIPEENKNSESKSRWREERARAFNSKRLSLPPIWVVSRNGQWRC